MKLSVGSKITIEAKSGKVTTDEGERLVLVLDIYTPWGPPIRNTTMAPPETLRAAFLWLRANYGVMAYDFVAARASIGNLVKRK